MYIYITFIIYIIYILYIYMYMYTYTRKFTKKSHGRTIPFLEWR